MKFTKPQSLKVIADIIGCSYIGASDFPVYGMNEIHVVTEGDIVFVDHINEDCRGSGGFGSTGEF